MAKLRVWWYREFEQNGQRIFDDFSQEVASVQEAQHILKNFAHDDLHSGLHITENGGGLDVYENGVWVEWRGSDRKNIFGVPI